MKKLFLSILMLAALTAHADISRTKKFTSAVPDDSAPTLTSSGVYNHRLTWTGAGTRTTCTIKLQKSADAITWADLIVDQSCTTDGSATTTGYANYVRIYVTALTGSGNTVFARYDGTQIGVSLGDVTVDTTGLATSAKQDTLAALLPAALASDGGLKVSPGTADAARGSAPANPPVPTALLADSTEPASVDDGDVVNPFSDLKGRQIVMLNSPLELKASGNVTLNAGTEQDIIAADASYKICVTDITVYNNDGTNSEVVQILDNGAIGTGTLMFYAAAPSLGGEAHLMTSPRCTSAINHKITVDSAGSANPVYISIGGFKTAE